jgi:hypothetical protein
VDVARTSTRLAFATLALAGAVSLGGCTTISTLWTAYELSTKPVPTPTAPSHPPTGLISLKVGDCISRLAIEDGDPSTPGVIPCATPHYGEVFASLTVPDGEYPSVDSLTNLGSTGCATAFGTFIGVDYKFSNLDFYYYYPTDSSWANGDRGIDCIVFDRAGKTIGTLAGAKR